MADRTGNARCLALIAEGLSAPAIGTQLHLASGRSRPTSATYTRSSAYPIELPAWPRRCAAACWNETEATWGRLGGAGQRGTGDRRPPRRVGADRPADRVHRVGFNSQLYPWVIAAFGVYALVSLVVAFVSPGSARISLLPALIDLCGVSLLVYTSGGEYSSLKFAFYVLPIAAALPALAGAHRELGPALGARLPRGDDPPS